MKEKKPQNIYELELNNYKLKEIEWKLIEKFANLKVLDLSCNQISKIENLHHLKVNLITSSNKAFKKYDSFLFRI